jgi:hypothetical protein
VIAIGGSHLGTRNVIYSAELMSRPVILIPAFGGASHDCFDYFRGRYYTGDEANLLRQSWSSDADTVAANVLKMTKSFTKRYHTTRVGRFALIDDGHQFLLVPWRPIVDRQLGRQVSGVLRGGSMSWNLGRERELGI